MTQLDRIESMLGRILGQSQAATQGLARLSKEVSRLRVAVRRPERARYRPAELAERLGISRMSVYRLWNSGKIQYKKDGRGRFSTEADVMAYVEHR